MIAGQILKVDNAKETRQPFPPEIEDPVFTPLPSILPEQTVRAGVYLGIPSKSNLFTNMTLDVQVSKAKWKSKWKGLTSKSFIRNWNRGSPWLQLSYPDVPTKVYFGGSGYFLVQSFHLAAVSGIEEVNLKFFCVINAAIFAWPAAHAALRDIYFAQFLVQ